MVVGTTSLAAIAVPVVIFTLVLRHLSAVLLASLALLEPVISLVAASAFGSLALALSGWIGMGSLLVALVLYLRAVAGSSPVVSKPEDEESDEQAHDEHRGAFSERGNA